jgi:hypothetical protein
MNNNIQYKLCNICNMKTLCICKKDKQTYSNVNIDYSSSKNAHCSKYIGNWKGKMMSLYIKELKLVAQVNN